jgi:hypothetical protein
MPTLDRYVRHAELYGVELVFETAVEGGLTIVELVNLARRLKAIDLKFDSPARPDQLIELAGAGQVRVPDDFPSAGPDKRHAYQRQQARLGYLERVGGVLDALGAPAPTSAVRCCEWCGKAIAGRVDRRTCSGAHREALRRAGGVGPFSRPDVRPTADPDLRVGLAESVTPTAHEIRRSEAESRGVGDFRGVSPRGPQLGLVKAAT